jgi:hypothetical protein
MSELKDDDEATMEEIALAQLTLLMRNYDLMMALLNHFDKDTADAIYEAHENGQTFNPAIWMAQVEAPPEV